MSISRMLISALSVLVCAAVAWGEDSGGYRGPTGGGTFPASGLARKWPEGGPPLLWKCDPGHGWAAPAIQNGTVYIAGGKTGFLHTFTLDGAPLDRYMIGPMDWKRFTGSRSVPTISGDMAVVSAPDSTIYGIDLARNETRWRVKAWKDFGGGKGSQGWGFTETPMLIENKVVFNPCSRDPITPPIVAVDIRTGKTVWETKPRLSDPNLPKRYSAADTSGTWAMHNGRPLVFMPTWMYLVCADGRTGELLWEIPSQGEKSLPPIYSDGYLLWDNGKTQMMKLSPDGKSYTRLWERPYSWLSGGAILGDKVFIFGAPDEEATQFDPNGSPRRRVAKTPGKEALLCVDKLTGKLLQSRPSVGSGHIVAADGLVFVLEVGPVLSLLEPCPSGFESRGSFKPTIDVGARSSDDLGSSKWIAPTIAEGRLFMRYGGLYVYDLRIEPDIHGWRNDGSGKYKGNPPIQWHRGSNVLWNVPVAGAAPSTPVVAAGRLYAASGPGALVCLDANSGKPLWHKEEKVAAAPGATPAALPPIVRGDRVFAVLGGSLAACYDTAGERKWAVPLDQPAAAPLALIGESLLVPGQTLACLDAASGKRRWQCAVPAGRSAGTPAVTWLRGTPLVVTSWGAVVTAEDGQALASGLAEGDTVLREARELYFATGKSDLALSAVELPQVIADPLKPRPLWKVALKGMASPVSMLAHKEWLYVLSAGGELAVLNRSSGKELTRKSLGKPAPGQAPVLTMSGTGNLYAGGFGEQGITIVLSAGAEPTKIWQYAGGAAGREPVFDRDRQYVLAGNRLWCVGGRAPVEPRPVTVHELAPPAELAALDKPEPMKSDVMPSAWIAIGPIKTDPNESDYLSAAGGCAKVFPKAGMEMKLGDESMKWALVPDANYWSDPRFSRGYRTLDISAAFKRKFHTSGCFFATVELDADRLVRFEAHLPNMRWKDFGNTLKGQAWVDGRPFEGKEYVLLRKGRHCIMLQASMGELPNSWGRVWAVPRFVDADDEIAAARKKYEQDLALWQEHARTMNSLFVLGE